MALLVVFLLSVVVVGVTARAGGAPAEACDTLTPQHSPNSPQTSAVPYVIDLEQFSDESGNLLYSPGQTYTLRLSDPMNGTTFRGFFVQSRLAADDTTRVGTFAVLNSAASRLSSCPRPEDGITHDNTGRTDFPAMMMNWTAPAEGTGPIRFAYAVVQQFSTFWANESGSTIYERESSTVSPTTFQPCPTCHPQAYCDYTGGVCRCIPGYTGDGEFCYDLDECEYRDPCSSYGEYAVCVNINGSYYCECEDGYEYTRNGCQREVYRYPGREVRDREGCYSEDTEEARYEIGRDIRYFLREKFGSGSGSGSGDVK